MYVFMHVSVFKFITKHVVEDEHVYSYDSQLTSQKSKFNSSKYVV